MKTMFSNEFVSILLYATWKSKKDRFVRVICYFASDAIEKVTSHGAIKMWMQTESVFQITVDRIYDFFDNTRKKAHQKVQFNVSIVHTSKDFMCISWSNKPCGCEILTKQNTEK